MIREAGFCNAARTAASIFCGLDELALMENTDGYPPGSLTVDGSTFAVVDLPAIGGARLAQLPIVLRLLLENVVRHMAGRSATPRSLRSSTGSSTARARPRSRSSQVAC
jgi:hypothetical protein